MPVSEWGEKLFERQQKLRERVVEVQGRVRDGLSYTFDRLLQECMDTYFILEERLEEFERLFSEIILEIDDTQEMASFQRLEQRFYYLEDSFEEFDSELRERPARRRGRRSILFDFFRQWQAEQERATQVSTEIQDAVEAYRVLGLAVGSDLKTVTAAFRRLVKGLHPDSRDGDRSTEPQLRKLMAAYRFVKKDMQR